MIGTKLSHYEVTSHLGTGGMGEVYQATDTKLGRSVAIKLLPEAFSRDADRAARFEREAKLLASLNHANIAGIYGLEQSGDTRFLVLELVEGDTLADRLQLGPIPVDEALKLALQIAQAVEAAHEKGVIHRDIKPANIKVTPDGKVKVLDFGLAKAFTPDERDMSLSNSPTLSMAATQQGLILGTAAYMSPEQASGQVADKRADVWSFGVVLFEMLTGRPLFRGKTISHVLADVLRADPDWNSLPANLHPRVRLLLERCLEKEARDRYHDIAEARVDIEHVLADPRGVLVQPATNAAPGMKAGPSVWLSVAAAAVIAGALGFLLRPVPAREPGTVVRFPLLLPDSTQFTSTPTSMIAISPDATRIAFLANGQLFLRNLNETEARPVPGTNEGGFGPGSPVFSPDGEMVAYIHAVTAGGPYIVKRVPVAGGTPVTVFTSKTGFEFYEWGLTWPKSDTMMFVHSDGIVRVSANGGMPEVLVKRSGAETFESPQILPGDDEILFVRLAAQNPGAIGINSWVNAEIVIQSIGDNDPTVVWKGGSHARYLPTGHIIYAQGNTLFALSIDLDSRKVTGGPVPVLEGIRRSSNGFTDAAQYAVSDTGVLVSIPGTNGSTIEKGVLALLDRKGVSRPFAVRPAQYRSPRFSPDGRQLAVEIVNDEGQSNIWIYDVSGKSEIRRMPQTGNNARPIWTPDGQRVTFASNRDGSWGVYEQPADGSTLAARLTTAKDSREHYPEAWSPDGKTLTFVEAVSANDWDIWTLSRDNKDPVLVASGPGTQFGSTFSPDGKWLVYTDNREPFGIHAQPFPPTGVVRQITQDGEAWPVWASTGEMFFRLRRDVGVAAQLRGLDVTTSGGFTFRNPRSLQLPADTLMYQGYRDFDITRNGDKFVIIVPDQRKTTNRPAVAPIPRIDVVLNWFEELKQRVPVP